MGQIPLDPATVTTSDKGQPIVVSMPDSTVASAFRSLAQRVVERLAEQSSGEDEKSGEEQLP